MQKAVSLTSGRTRARRTLMNRRAGHLAVMSMMTWLEACGGGGGDGGGDGPRPPVINQRVGATCTAFAPAPPARITSLTTADISALANATEDGRQLVAFLGAPVCGVDVFDLQYGTTGAVGERTSASAALMIPTGNAASCQGPRPIVLYGHGTTFQRGYSMGFFRTSGDPTGAGLANAFASHGYIVVAPNYAGYDCSELPYHPYLVAAQQSQ